MKATFHRSAALFGAALAGLTLALPVPAEAQELNIYSYRQPGIMDPLFAAFEEETGIKPNLVFAKEGLEQRIQAEGENSPADLLITVDIGRIDEAVQLGLAQPIESQTIEEAVPAAVRSLEDGWTGLSMRARVFYVSKDRVENPPTTYEALADPEWEGRICTRSGQHVYNIGLFAAMVVHHGEEAAKEWLQGLKNNLASAPSGNDRAQAKAIFAGECDIGIGNSYYVGLMKTNEKEPEQQEWAEAINVVLPTFEGTGKTHVNVSGAVLLKNAPNKDTAVRFLEFLVSERAQELYAKSVYEYPVVEGVPLDPIVASLGELNPDETPLTDIAAARQTASELVDEVDYNAGPDS